jgi:hypothetical protein
MTIVVPVLPFANRVDFCAARAWPHSPPDCVRKGRHYARSAENGRGTSVVAELASARLSAKIVRTPQ